MNWKRLRKKILEDVYPDQEELEQARNLYQEISEFIGEKYDLETHFAGSTSRQTCMKGDKDIDIFVLFPEDTDRQKLEDKGLEIGKKAFEEFEGDFEVDYAEHPYTKGEIKSHEVEIVPCFDVEAENIQSAVDRTPHHSRWVQKNLSEEQREDVVILKKFLKESGLYGSSLKVQGFSGYLCEILISEFGSFDKLTERVQEWPEEKVLDPENHHEDLPKNLENKFSEDSLVVIDPVDPERNVASVLSTENYAKFVHLCWQFNKNPGLSYFEEKESDWTEFELKQEIQGRADIIALKFDRPTEVDDIVYPQMRKLMRLLTQRLERSDFRIFESGFQVDEDNIRFFFELDSTLPEVEELKGPKVFHNSKHLDEFSSKYENTFVRGDRLYAKTERDFTHAKEFLKDFFDDDVQRLREKGVPNNISDKVVKYSFFDVLEEDEKWLNYLAEELNV